MTALDWDELYREYHPQLISYLTWRGAEPLLAQDLAQDAFVRAMHSAHQFSDDGRGVGPWLVTITRNLLFDHLKLAHTRREGLAEDPDVFFRCADACPSAEDVVLGLVAQERLRAAMRHLTPEQREILVLQHWSGWSMERIGRRQFRSERAVKTMAGRARDSLRRRLREAA